jgi:hypothetical protein
MGVDLGGNGFDSRKIASEIKTMEEQGYQFDVADGSLKILLQKFTEQFKPLFLRWNRSASPSKKTRTNPAKHMQPSKST